MNTIRNSVNLIGNLGGDPVIKEFGKEGKVAKFSVATNESYQGQNGEWVTKTSWHNIVAWNKMAEICQKNLSKGNKIALEGKLINGSFETKEGETVYKTEIQLREFIVANPENK
ncbi:MAG: single-stranded DNA-binding protein [Brumimicrobium sp.]